MALSIMALNMRKLRRLPESRHIPIQMPNPFMQMRVTAPDIPDIGLEMLDVHSIEPHYRCIEPDIRLRDVFPEIERPLRGREVFLGTVQGGE